MINYQRIECRQEGLQSLRDEAYASTAARQEMRRAAHANLHAAVCRFYGVKISELTTSVLLRAKAIKQSNSVRCVDIETGKLIIEIGDITSRHEDGVIVVSRKIRTFDGEVIE